MSDRSSSQAAGGPRAATDETLGLDSSRPALADGLAQPRTQAGVQNGSPSRAVLQKRLRRWGWLPNAAGCPVGRRGPCPAVLLLTLPCATAAGQPTFLIQERYSTLGVAQARPGCMPCVAGQATNTATTPGRPQAPGGAPLWPGLHPSGEPACSKWFRGSLRLAGTWEQRPAPAPCCCCSPCDPTCRPGYRSSLQQGNAAQLCSCGRAERRVPLQQHMTCIAVVLGPLRVQPGQHASHELPRLSATMLHKVDDDRPSRQKLGAMRRQPSMAPAAQPGAACAEQ